MSEIKSNKISSFGGFTITLGDSGDLVSIDADTFSLPVKNKEPLNYSPYSMYIDNTFNEGRLKFRSKNKWKTIVKTAPSCTGGTITTPGDGYKYHTFTSSGDFTVNSPDELVVQVFIVSGGGSGGCGTAGTYENGGGGGAGGAYFGSIILESGLSYTATIGAGDAGSTTESGSGGVGGTSYFYAESKYRNKSLLSIPRRSFIGDMSSQRFYGGGAGGSADVAPASAAGVRYGSGGGGVNYGGQAIGRARVGRFGYSLTGDFPEWPAPGHEGGAGANTGSSTGISGGGGGWGEKGYAGDDGTKPGVGGDGIEWPLGSGNWYAGGGGAGGQGSVGGQGGGGTGGSSGTINGTNGTANTGGGGGGNYADTGVAGGGGSGIVIVRYRI